MGSHRVSQILDPQESRPSQSLPFWVFGEVGLPVLVAVRVVPEADGHRGERRGAHQLAGLRARLHRVAILVPALMREQTDQAGAKARQNVFQTV